MKGKPDWGAEAGTKRKTNRYNGRSFYHREHSLSSRYTFVSNVAVLSLSSGSHSRESGISRNNVSTEEKENKNRSNIITIETVDSSGQELPLRTREYRRRKHEWAERYTSQEGLREAFGRNRNRWWGDLDAQTARRLYKRLLFPAALSELVLELGDEIVRPEELAPLAYEARKAAKMYVRERCRVPSRVGAYLIDGFRQLYKYGKFQPNGASYEQIWIRYYEEYGSSNHTEEELIVLLTQNDNQDTDSDVDIDNDDIVLVEDIIDDIDDAVTEDEIIKRTCQKILEKSCTTNGAIDRFYLRNFDQNSLREECSNLQAESISSCDANQNDCNKKVRKSRGSRWRNRKRRKDRYNDLFLEKITNTLERDVRKLLEPPPPLLHSPTEQEEEGTLFGQFMKERAKCNAEIDRVGECETNKKEGDWSSRRMTRQEYHSLKLFAKAMKRSQQQYSESNANDATKRISIDDIALTERSENIDIVTVSKAAEPERTRNKDR
ncbi:unnamed protein product [Pseudo-nitzschia multistriata]|uniref:Uncharacterized protein n=1 Tax=Pseudo-nitzschia multistriata TaxID=183589 RepID=A0A448ZMS9_9STRA|nr:unnamed protein product [Pseudo-nitzschia multistriata]